MRRNPQNSKRTMAKQQTKLLIGSIEEEANTEELNAIFLKAKAEILPRNNFKITENTRIKTVVQKIISSEIVPIR